MPEAIDNGGNREDAEGDLPRDELDPKVVNRRDALKKAAIGAGIAGAVWSAPRIEGLSLVPDYAAAGTIPPNSTILFKATVADCSPSLLNPRNCWGNCVPATIVSNCAPFQFMAPAYAPAMAVGTAPGGTASQFNATNMLSAPAPPGPNQNEFFDVVWSGTADQGSTSGMAALMFMLDPPFNMCAVTAVQGQLFDLLGNMGRDAWPSAQFMSTNHPGTVPFPPSPITTVVGADVNFAVPATKQGADVTITITCT